MQIRSTYPLPFCVPKREDERSSASSEMFARHVKSVGDCPHAAGTDSMIAHRTFSVNGIGRKRRKNRENFCPSRDARFFGGFTAKKSIISFHRPKTVENKDHKTNSKGEKELQNRVASTYAFTGGRVCSQKDNSNVVVFGGRKCYTESVSSLGRSDQRRQYERFKNQKI